MRILFLILLVISFLSARYDAVPSKSCEAFDNMKHTKNSNNVRLDTTKVYTVLRSHKGQKLIIAKGANPSLRWVEEECFDKESNKEEESLEAMQAELNRLEREMRLALGKDKNRNLPSNSKNIKQNYSTAAQNKIEHYEKRRDRTSKEKQKSIPLSESNLLALSWHNAFCQTHRYKKECKRDTASLLRPKEYDNRFVLHGLWPQPRKKVYCGVDKSLVLLDKEKRWSQLPDLDLTAQTRDRLSQIMPGVQSDLHKHEWIKHGTCYGTDSNSYYQKAINLTEQFNHSSLAAFFKINQGKKVTLTQIKKIAQKEFGKGASKSIAIECKGGLITEIWLQLGYGSDNLASLLKRGKKLYSRCKAGYVDKAGFSKKGIHRSSFGR